MRRRSPEAGWPKHLERFRESDWPQPESGPDPGAVGLRCGDAGQFLATIADSGLAAAWSKSFAFRRFAEARLAYLGEDHPYYMDCWLTWIGSFQRFVREYVAGRDRV